MGVPKFFRYISERYPCLSELIRENQIPDFDNLYLDMNGIIHSCSHPNDSDIYFRITEEQIFKDIFHYIDTLFLMIKPKKLFFMAIDGVAPRAKMNQQRGRRFRSAKEAEVLEKKAKGKGEKLPVEERFDSNCITPGTPFMARLQEGLKFFVQMKITTNPLWQNCRVILSGHETPGEGEHKIMEYIRFLKAQENYDHNTRHCLYGLDADLIMLGLCTHELYFSLLREEVKFGRQTKRAPSVNETRFFLLHLGLLREYLELEFSDVKDKLTFDYNIERIIDDWIFMGFLVGNDFIPHLPNLHIAGNALPLLYAAYMEVLPTMDGYINEYGKLNLGRLELFIKRLAIVDKDLFTQLSPEFHHLDTKLDDILPLNLDVEEEITKIKDISLEEFIKNQDEFMDDMDNESEIIDQEFRTHKRNYYINKMHYPEMTSAVLKEQTECYIRALQWTLSYYYHGVQSWSWYYPYHYAPYISDVTNFRDFKIDFDLGKPFLPFEQLLAVLPAASKNHLPLPYRRLMTDPNSKVIEYYPVDFETDLNGKKQDWEAVVLIPFIDEVLLLDAMRPCNKELQAEEKGRNIHGPMLQYDYTEISQGQLLGKFGYPDMANIMCSEKKLARDDIYIPEDKLILELAVPSNSKYHLGFPTMKHLQYSSSMVRSRVKVFEQSSRNDNMVINLIIYDEYKDVNGIANELLDKQIFVSWPHLRIAKVCKISDENSIYTLDGVKENNPKKFELQSKSIVEHHMGRLGIDVGEIRVIVHVNVLIGQHYIFEEKGIMKLKQTWDTFEVLYPIQAIVKHIDYYKKTDESDKKVEEIFSPGTTVFLLSSPYYGSKGEVIDPTIIQTCGRIKVCLNVFPEPDFQSVYKIHETSKLKYLNSYNAAATIGISTNILSRITGSILIIAGARRSVSSDTPKSNVGLQLKFTKNNEEVVGFTRKHGGVWYYSPSAIDLVERFGDEFPELFRSLGNSEYASNDMFFEFELFPKNTEENNIDRIIKWLKAQPHSSAERRTCGTEVVEKETVSEIMNVISHQQKNGQYKIIKLQVKPHLLYKPGLQITEKAPDPNATYTMFDRVIIARNINAIPIGFVGTIIGIHHIKDPNPVRLENLKSYDICFDVLFDEEFEEGTSIYGIAAKRVFRVPKNSVINISFGSDKKPWNFDQATAPDNKAGGAQQKPYIAWSTPLNMSNTDNTYDNNSRQRFNNGSGGGGGGNGGGGGDGNGRKQNKYDDYQNNYMRVKQKQEAKKKVETWFKTSMNDAQINNLDIQQHTNQYQTQQKHQQKNQHHQQQHNQNLDKNLINQTKKTSQLNKNLNDNKQSTEQTKRGGGNIDMKTFTLRKMLGVPPDTVQNLEEVVTEAKSQPPKQITIAKKEQHTVLSVDEFFKMHQNSPNKPPVTNLPQPPQNWRKEAAFIDVSKLENRPAASAEQIIQQQKPSNQITNQETIKISDKRHPPGQPTMNINNAIVSSTPTKTNQNVMHHPQPNRWNYQEKQNSKQEFKPMNIQEQIIRPNGPQNLMEYGHGAFIPLQAVKNINKTKPPTNTNQQPPHRFVLRNAEQRQEVQQKQTESNENFATFMKDDNNSNTIIDSKEKNLTESIPIQKNVPKPRNIPKSRIAAKFQLADN